MVKTFQQFHNWSLTKRRVYFIGKIARKFLAESKAIAAAAAAVKLSRKISAQTLNRKCQLTPCGWCNWVWVIPLAREFNVRRTLTGESRSFPSRYCVAVYLAELTPNDWHVKTQSVKLAKKERSSLRERESRRYPVPSFRPVPKSLLARRTVILAPRRLDKRARKKKRVTRDEEKEW